MEEGIECGQLTIWFSTCEGNCDSVIGTYKKKDNQQLLPPYSVSHT